MWRAVRQHEELKERHRKDVGSLEHMVEKLTANFREAVSKKEIEMGKFKEILELESSVSQTVITRLHAENEQQKSYIHSLETILSEPFLGEEFVDRMKTYRR